MAKHDPKARTERREAKPLHAHALDKASATHLYNGGHIDEATHDAIVKHAERGMAKAKRNAGR